MGSLNLSLGGAGEGISAEMTFINGLETIQEHSFNLLFHDQSFWKQIKDQGHCLEGNQGDEDGLLISNNSTGRNEVSEKTGNSKKIWWIEGNKSNSPHLCGRFFDLGWDFAGGLISRFFFLTLKPTLVHQMGTGRGPRAATWTDAENSFLTGAGHVYPHLDEAHAPTPPNLRIVIKNRNVSRIG